MKAIFPTAILAVATLTAGSAFAAQQTCNEPKAEWQPQQQLRTQLEKDGWLVRSIEVEHGCYEIKAVDKQGKRMETSYNPRTLQRMGNTNEATDGED